MNHGMNEDELESLIGSRPYTTDDAKRAQEQDLRRAALALALWGRTSEDLQRQLLAPHPEIPTGFELADFRELLRTAEMLAAAFRDPRKTSWLKMPQPTIFVSNREFTLWEARVELLRRAIEHLENG